jgi:hypothetical protein
MLTKYLYHFEPKVRGLNVRVNKQCYGCIVATKIDGEIRYGSAFCNTEDRPAIVTGKQIFC